MHEFDKQLDMLLQQQCWAVIAGGIGSMATIHLGKKLRRTMPLRGVGLGELLRDFQGEYCISIRGCAWRLEKSGTIVCGWRENTDVIEVALRKLEGFNVVGIRIENDFLDLAVNFDNQMVLRLFCDQTAAEESLSNYSIRTPEGQFRVGPRSTLVVDDLV